MGEIAMNILDKLTNYLIETKYESLPKDVVEATRRQILDTLGVTAAGSTCSISGEMNGLAEMVKDWGGKKESTLIAFGGRVPAPNAAFVNATSSMRLDFDDTLVTWINLHTSRVIIPTAFAMAERQGNISGKELIAAVALGYDFACRIKQASGGNKDNAVKSTCNFFGAAATAARLLGLEHERFQDALFLAFHQMGGAGGSGGGGIRSGAGLKGVSNGFAAKAGIISALMAEKGFTAAPDFLEAENKENYYEIFCGGSYLPWLLTSDLGKAYTGAITAQKEYPCCHGQHASIEAALGLMKENHLKPADVAEVNIRLSPFDYFLLAEPLERKQNPQNIIETQFSVCWGVASAIVYGGVGIPNFGKEALKDSRVKEMARKVKPRIDKAMAREQGFPPAAIDIKTGSGKVYSRQVDFPFGTPGNPMTFADVALKFKECCRYSANPIPPENRDKVIKMVEGLEKVNDAGRIVRLLG
jgi:2-methylcitrate dehydratase PrpD